MVRLMVRVRAQDVSSVINKLVLSVRVAVQRSLRAWATAKKNSVIPVTRACGPHHNELQYY